jgi:hypothetical protein
MPYSEIIAVCYDIRAKYSMGKVQGVHVRLQKYEKPLLASSCLSGRNIGWMTKATDTHSKYVTLTALPRQQNAPSGYGTRTLPVLLIFQQLVTISLDS